MLSTLYICGNMYEGKVAIASEILTKYGFNIIDAKWGNIIAEKNGVKYFVGVSTCMLGRNAFVLKSTYKNFYHKVHGYHLFIKELSTSYLYWLADGKAVCETLKSAFPYETKIIYLIPKYLDIVLKEKAKEYFRDTIPKSEVIGKRVLRKPINIIVHYNFDVYGKIDGAGNVLLKFRLPIRELYGKTVLFKITAIRYFKARRPVKVEEEVEVKETSMKEKEVEEEAQQEVETKPTEKPQEQVKEKAKETLEDDLKFIEDLLAST